MPVVFPKNKQKNKLYIFTIHLLNKKLTCSFQTSLFYHKIWAAWPLSKEIYLNLYQQKPECVTVYHFDKIHDTSA
jgi:hypothetical protein